jgi:hypothetical protein
MAFCQNYFKAINGIAINNEYISFKIPFLKQECVLYNVYNMQ